MRARMAVRMLAAMGSFLLAGSVPSSAQTIGPGGVPIAPWLPLPGYTPGGVGPGGTEIAPGPAARGIAIEQTGPGFVRLAPGPAGEIQRQRLAPLRPAPLAGSSTIGASIMTDEGARMRHGPRGSATRAKHRPVRHRHVPD